MRPPANWFWVVRVSGAVVTPRASQLLALTHRTGASLELAEEQLGPVRDVVLVAGDQEPTLQTELVLCLTCYGSELSLAQLVERRKPTAPPPGPEAA